MVGSNSTALLVVGHGTRSREGLAEYWHTIALTARHLPDVVVKGCFLDKVDPNIDAAIGQLAHDGIRQIIVVPLLLSNAWHARSDIPREIGGAAARYGVRAVVAPVLGDHRAILELSAWRFREAIQSKNADPRQVCWVFVGRGGSCPDTERQCRVFFAQRQRMVPVRESLVALLTVPATHAMHVERVLDEALRVSPVWVVVQPHMLFAGELFSRLQRMVDRQDGVSDRQQWLIAGYLGCDERLVRAIVARFRQSLVS